MKSGVVAVGALPVGSATEPQLTSDKKSEMIGIPSSIKDSTSEEDIVAMLTVLPDKPAKHGIDDIPTETDLKPTASSTAPSTTKDVKKASSHKLSYFLGFMAKPSPSQSADVSRSPSQADGSADTGDVRANTEFLSPEASLPASPVLQPAPSKKNFDKAVLVGQSQLVASSAAEGDSTPFGTTVTAPQRFESGTTRTYTKSQLIQESEPHLKALLKENIGQPVALGCGYVNSPEGGSETTSKNPMEMTAVGILSSADVAFVTLSISAKEGCKLNDNSYGIKRVTVYSADGKWPILDKFFNIAANTESNEFHDIDLKSGEVESTAKGSSKKSGWFGSTKKPDAAAASPAGGVEVVKDDGCCGSTKKPDAAAASPAGGVEVVKDDGCWGSTKKPDAAAASPAGGVKVVKDDGCCGSTKKPDAAAASPAGGVKVVKDDGCCGSTKKPDAAAASPAGGVEVVKDDGCCGSTKKPDAAAASPAGGVKVVKDDGCCKGGSCAKSDPADDEQKSATCDCCPDTKTKKGVKVVEDDACCAGGSCDKKKKEKSADTAGGGPVAESVADDTCCAGGSCDKKKTTKTTEEKPKAKKEVKKEVKIDLDSSCDDEKSAKCDDGCCPADSKQKGDDGCCPTDSKQKGDDGCCPTDSKQKGDGGCGPTDSKPKGDVVVVSTDCCGCPVVALTPPPVKVEKPKKGLKYDGLNSGFLCFVPLFAKPGGNIINASALPRSSPNYRHPAKNRG